MRGAEQHIAVVLLLLLCFICFLEPSSGHTAMSVKQLKSEMYKTMSFSRGCYKLLNAKGAVGCEEPTGTVVNYPLMAWHHLMKTKLDAPRVVVVPQGQLSDLIAFVDQTPELKHNLKGVLVDPTDNPQSFSPAPRFPHADLAPYSDTSYEWNPAGSDLLKRYFPFPMYVLTPQLAKEARKRAAYNHDQEYQGEVQEAKMNLKMFATNNSISCLNRGTCNPMGGYSIWSAVPPLPTLPGGNTTSSGLPITMVTAQVDGTGLFHDIIQGAESSMSGLMALLSALDILKAVNASTTYTRQLVFVALVGEPWGLMGSRRLMWELGRGGPSVQGIEPRLIDQVIEVGPVGKGVRKVGGSTQLFAHTQKSSSFGDASGLVDSLKAAASSIQASTDVKVSVSAPSSSTPGIPPSSLMTILKVNSAVKGVVLTDFDQQFSTSYYASALDNLTSIDKLSVGNAAVLLARTLHGLAVGDDTVADATFKVNMTTVRTMVDSLSQCLLTRTPGFACPMVLSLMMPGYRTEGSETSYEVQRYIGVLPFSDTRDPLNPAFKQDISRFIWNFMAWKTALTGIGAACDPIKNVCPAGQVCVGWKVGTKPQGAGRCLNATARYTPAYSPRVECIFCNNSNYFRYVVTNRSLDWERQHNLPADPVWAESMWPQEVPDLQLLLRESPTVENAVLAAGCVLTAFSFAAAFFIKRVLEQHLKVN